MRYLAKRSENPRWALHVESGTNVQPVTDTVSHVLYYMHLQNSCILSNIFYLLSQAHLYGIFWNDICILSVREKQLGTTWRMGVLNSYAN